MTDETDRTYVPMPDEVKELKDASEDIALALIFLTSTYFLLGRGLVPASVAGDAIKEVNETILRAVSLVEQRARK